MCFAKLIIRIFLTNHIIFVISSISEHLHLHQIRFYPARINLPAFKQFLIKLRRHPFMIIFSPFQTIMKQCRNSCLKHCEICPIRTGIVTFLFETRQSNPDILFGFDEIFRICLPSSLFCPKKQNNRSQLSIFFFAAILISDSDRLKAVLRTLMNMFPHAVHHLPDGFRQQTARHRLHNNLPDAY